MADVKKGKAQADALAADTLAAEAQPEQKPGKFHAFKYWADVVKWVINLVGIVVDSIKENPFPKKDDYTTA